MFILKIYDRVGAELNEGDIVKISDGREAQFYCEVKYSEKDQCIYPFHTFSFNSVLKVDKVPDHAVRSEEERYGIWYLVNKEDDPDGLAFKKYLLDWRQCEHLLDERMFRIEKQTEPQLKLF